jgi:hypothetical protein
MGSTHTRWRACVAQAVALLLVGQTVLGLVACPNHFGFASDALDAALEGAICSHASTPAGKSNPAKKTQHDCPICLSFVCQGGAILSADLIIPVPGREAVPLPGTPSAISASEPPTVHNRDPPRQIQA